jgi:predicted RNA-binding protein with TRAM domain
MERIDMNIKKNDVFEVIIEDMSESGEGVGKLDGYIWFIKDAVIGDLIEAKAMKMKKNTGTEIHKFLSHSSRCLRQEHVCKLAAGALCRRFADARLTQISITINSYLCIAVLKRV